MKSNATMHDLAAAIAATKGPRIMDVPNSKGTTIIAICITPDELKHLFASEGYRTDGDKHLAKIKAWGDRGDTILYMGHAIFPMESVAQRLLAEKLAEGHENVLIMGLDW